MRLGLVGPADGDVKLLREAAEFLLGDCGVDEAIYLGIDKTIRHMVDAWSVEIMGGPAGESAFLRQAAAVALDGDATQIATFLSETKKCTA